MQAIDTNAKNDKFQSKDMEGKWYTFRISILV